MHNVIDNLNFIQNEIKVKIKKLNFSNYNPKIIAVSKTFQMKDIIPLINYGHIHFGENKIQEALEKWMDVKNDFKNIKLHMIGKLQSNKVKFAVKLFDYIHSVDNLKLAKKISEEQKKLNKNIKIFIQINIGNETQKSGVDKNKVNEFALSCKKLGLNVIGIMCLPPNDSQSDIYFSKMLSVNKTLGFKEISMGMSSDYINAINFQATYLRIGSKIFGERN